MLFNIDLNNALNPHVILNEGKKIAYKILKEEDRGTDITIHERIKYYSGSRLFLALYPGILKAYIESIKFPTLGSPSYENTFLFMKERIGNYDIPFKYTYKIKRKEIGSGDYFTPPKTKSEPVFDDETILKYIRLALQLFRDKYSHDPEYYSALPISHIHSSGARSNICMDLHPEVLKIHPDFKPWMIEMADDWDGVIPFTIGLSESLIGLIPLYERGLIDLDLQMGYPIYKLRRNATTEQIWKSLKEFAEPFFGSPLYARYVGGFITDIFRQYVEIETIRDHDIDDDKLRKILTWYIPLLIRGNYGFSNREGVFWETVFQEKETRMGKYDPGVIKTILDPYEKYPINRAIRAKYYGTPEFRYGLSRDERIAKVLEEAIDKYLSEKDAEFLREKKIDLESYLELSIEEIFMKLREAELSNKRFENPIYLRKIELIKEVSQKHGLDWYHGYWRKVKEIGDDVADITPKRSIKDSERDLKLFLISIGEAYIYFYRFFASNLFGFPLLKAEVRLLKDYLEENYGIKFKWKDIIKTSIGTLAQAGKVAVVGKGYAKKFYKHGLESKPIQVKRYRKIPLEPEEAERERVEKAWNFDWLRYERLLDEAKENLDRFERFKQLYYLQRALAAYEDARRLLYDMYNRYRKYEDKERIIMEKLILINRQIDEVREMLDELKRKGY